MTRSIPILALLIDFIIHQFIPNKQSLADTKTYETVLIAGMIIYLVVLLFSISNKVLRVWLSYRTLWLFALFIFFGIWDLVTLKLALLRLPYFPGPDKVLGGFLNDWQLLLTCAAYSLRLLLTGYILGASLGLATGVFMGWYQRCNYWMGPLLKIIGPIPATAWMPIAMVAFPTSFLASVFLITLAVWFPVTVMTSSGIANVRNAYFEVAKTLGADQKYLIFKVAVPAATPMIFIGLFMGMGASFLTLIAAEMLGVKAGLGWYINWAQ